MDDSWQQFRACSNRSSSQHFPLPGSRNQIEMNFGQYSHPYFAQEVCVIERTIRQEPIVPNTLNYGCAGFGSKVGRPDIGNSFLALLSGPSQQFRSDYQQSSSLRSAALSGNSPFYQISALENGAWPPLAASDVSPINQASGNVGFGSGRELSQIGVSREVPSSSYNRVTAYHDNCEPGNFRIHGPDVSKQVVRQNVNESEADLQASVPQWLTDAANLRQQQLQSMQSVRLSKSLMETGCSEVEQSSSMMKSMPRVFCMGTSGLLSGELVLSDTGLGVRCSCHRYQMSVSKFSEHSGLSSGNPGTQVRMENGESIIMWWKSFLSQLGVKVPDDERGWDWTDANSTETGTAKYKSTSSQNMEKESASSYRMDNSTVKARNTQSWNNPVDRNNSYEGHAAQGLSNGSFLPSTAQRNVQEVRETLLKNFSRACKGGMSTQLNPQLLEKHKENLPRASDVSSNNSYRGSPNYVNTSGSEYIDFINNGGQPFFPNQGPAGIKNFQKGFTLSSMNNIQESIPPEKDTMSSSFELRLGQPSQQTHALRGPLQPSLDPQVSNATMERHKPIFLERMLQRVYDPSLPEVTQQGGPCNLPAFSGNKEKGKERQFEHHLHGIGRPNAMESGCINHLKEDSMRGSVMSMFLPSGGHSDGPVREVPLQSMNIVMGDPEQLLNKLTHFNADSHAMKHDALGGLRNQVIGFPNKGCIQSMDYGSNPSQSKFGMSVGPSAACDMYGSSSSLIQTKPRFDNRLLHEIIPGQCLPLEVAMQNKHSPMNETQKATVSPIEADIRNGPSPMALASSFGSSDHSDAFWQRTINSALLKNSGPFPLSAAAHLNIPRVGVAASMSKVTDNVENKLHVEARQMQMSDDQLRSMLDFKASIQVYKSNETTPNISYQEPKSVMSREQGQLAGLFSNTTIPVQRSCIQEELRNESNSNQGMSHLDKHGLGSVCGNAAGISQVCNDQDISGPPEKSNFLSGPCSSQCNAPNSKEQILKHSQTEDVFVQQIDCSMPCTIDRPLRRLTRLSQCLNNPDAELTILEQKDSNRVVASEKEDQSGDPESPECKEASRADVAIAESKETATSAALGTNSAVVVSVGENDSGTEKGFTQQNQNIERHDIMNTVCQSFQWKEDNGNVVAEAGVMHDECPVDNMDSRETVEDHLADTAAKGSTRSVISAESPKKKHHLSNACSKSSENVFSEFSDAGHVINDEICNVDSGGKKLMRTDIVDEGSGIGKCCSSDAIDSGVWTRRKLASVNEDKRLLGSPPMLPYPSTSDVNDASRVRSSLRLKRLSSAATCSLAEKERSVQTIARSGKLEKKRRTMKWKRLDAAAATVENKNKMPLSLNRVKCPDRTFLPSAQVMKPTETQCGTASVSSTPTRGPNLKRKRSVLVSRNPLQYKHKTQQFQEDKRKEESVQQIQFKGDKLVIRIRQASVHGKAKQSKVDGIEQDIDMAGSRMVSKCGTTGSSKKLSLRKKDTRFPKDKTKLAQCLTSMRSGHSKTTSKTAKMVSLRSILNQPEYHLDNKEKEKLKQSSVKGVGNLTLNKSGGKMGKYSLLQRRLANESPETLKDSVETNPKSDRKESSGLVNAREIRKRSLCELTGKNKPENKSNRCSIPDAAAQSKSVCHVDPSNSVGGEFSINHCSVPRGERTLRVRFKCKSKGHFPKPNLTTSAGSRTWFSENPHLSSDIVSHYGGMRSKLCAPESGSQSIFTPLVKDKHNISRDETSPIEQPLSSFTKLATGKGLNMRSMLDKKETKVLDNPASKVLRKQKRLKNGDKSRDHADKWPEMRDRSLAVESDCKTAKLKKRSNDHFFGGKHGNNPLQKKSRTENAHLGSNVGADVPCCVCGDSKEEGINRIVQCGRCLIKVHQACYGVAKIPKGGWTCRACKANLSNIVCVLCGYGGGAMTRAQKTRNVVKSLLQVWQVTNDISLKVLPGKLPPLSSKGNRIDEVSAKTFLGTSESSKTELMSPGFSTSNIVSFGKEDSNKTCFRSSLEDDIEKGSGQVGKVKKYLNGEFKVHNTITAAVNDPTVTQWVHVVCGLWMPGTRCLNVSTMGVFDVSGAALPRKKLVCSICNRPGGLSIQCRVVNCCVPFHPWCAHQKGLLQSEIEGDDGDRVGFYGRCMHHGKYDDKYSEMAQSGNTLPANPRLETDKGTCARTEGYKGLKSWEEYRSELRRQSEINSTKVVSQEQINVWLHIIGRKSCTRGLIKPPNIDIKTDYRREYLRFKQEQGWKRLVVYKSGIHALGLYTAEFISKGEMVVEYVGEIVGLRVADKREANYHSRGKMQYEGACYFFRIDKESIIDATRKGGIARFVNHSCSPNCVAKVISVRTQKKVVFFAVRDINAGEEITYDYHFNHEDDGKKIPCFCNSRTCRRYLN